MAAVNDLPDPGSVNPFDALAATVAATAKRKPPRKRRRHTKRVREAVSGVHVALYLRVSQDKSRRGEESVELQEKNARAYLDRYPATFAGLPVVVYCDNDKSGADPNVARPDFDALCEAIDAGLVAYVVVRNQARILRHSWEAFLDRCVRGGVEQIHRYEEGTIDVGSPNDHLQSEMTGVFNKHYVAMVTKGVHGTLADRVAKGLPKSGGTPYGYLWGEDANRDRTFVVFEPEAAVLRIAAERLLNLGETLADVCRHINAAGIVGRDGAPWKGTTLARRLLSPYVGGWLAVRGKVVKRGAWVPIFDEDTYARLVALLDGDRTRVSHANGVAYSVPRKRGRPSAHLLSGVLRCPCGHHLTGTRVPAATDPGVKVRRYRCVSSTGGCGQNTITDGIDGAHNVDRVVVDLVLAALQDPETRAALAQDDYVEERRAAVDEEAVLIARKAEWFELAQDGEMKPADWAPMEAGFDRKIAAVRDRLRAIPPARGKDWDQVVSDWETMDVAQRRAVIRDVTESITVTPRGRGYTGFDASRIVIVPRVEAVAG